VGGGTLDAVKSRTFQLGGADLSYVKPGSAKEKTSPEIDSRRRKIRREAAGAQKLRLHTHSGLLACYPPKHKVSWRGVCLREPFGGGVMRRFLLFFTYISGAQVRFHGP